MNRALSAPIPPGGRIAVVGGGVSGLSAAWLLSEKYSVTLFEAGSYVGGHTNTVDAEVDGIRHPVDTGFLVHNDLTYPNLVQLFRHLNIPVHASDMTFSVSLAQPDLEWAGTSLGTVFAQRRNLMRPAFLGMLRDILRFNRHAARYLARCGPYALLGDLLDDEGYGQAMRDWYLLPMAGAIWSTPPSMVLQQPARTFLSFCLNHRLLQVAGRPQWKTVKGGARQYVNAMLPRIADVRVSSAVHTVKRLADGVEVRSAGHVDRYDAVVLACHAPTSLAMLDASEDERDVLSRVRYQPNVAVLHTDTALLPRRRAVWSAWNYLAGPTADAPMSVSYLLNHLQPLPFKQPVIVTLNPQQEPAASSVLGRFDYEHPVLDADTVVAQGQLAGIQGRARTWFCGAWTGYGFHEDGLASAIRVAADFGVSPPWSTAP
ncbi:NAD(P)/FAD-dependent oxidoreductase [Achromobacter kerstersii]|uniref:NAD(P)/FAD-dependent oxidoreductase n=1 Tax=Achromobacter kerstersii TaxID=1353890 RepID=UPI0006C33E6D|nr:FAD-dependent oxidoreductase [Achromobacter kerstersii]CUI89776.1 protoporphyrinogen oxidase [Achromobacter kerstersii]